MKIAEDIMKVTGVILIAGLAGCSGSSWVPDASPGPVPDPGPDASFCSLETGNCPDGWLDAGVTPSDAGGTPKSIHYNALGTNALMFNALLRNPRVNWLMTQHSLKSLLDTSPSTRTSEAAEFQLQLEDPFARRMMHYLVGCALEDGHGFTWTDPVSGNSVTWEGDVGLCPEWETTISPSSPMSSTCQELLSACLLARNNALDKEVLISVRGNRWDPSGAVTVPLQLETSAKGGEPRESGVDSFETPCASPMTSPTAPTSNCKGWHSRYVGTCVAGDMVDLTVNVVTPGTNPLIRICDGIEGCDSTPRPRLPDTHINSTQIPCNPGDACTKTISFPCSARKAFTLMYADPDPANPSSFMVSVAGTTAAGTTAMVRYPAPEEEVFPWQEGAFYGNLFCQNASCTGQPEPVDTSLWVEVQAMPPAVIYHHGSDNTPVHALASGDERTLLNRRNMDHLMFVSKGYKSSKPVYRQMYACMSPNWEPFTALLRNRLCAGPATASICAAYSTGRCWSVENTTCQCRVDDVLPMTGDRDYGDCLDDTRRQWAHPLTVFLNDPCDIVPESVYPEKNDRACQGVPLCRQTTKPSPWMPFEQPPPQ